jgi:hypothetical protein
MTGRRLPRIASARTAARRGALAGVVVWLLHTPIGLTVIALSDRAGPQELGGLLFLLLDEMLLWCVVWALVWFIHLPWYFLAVPIFSFAAQGWLAVHVLWLSHWIRNPWLAWVASGLPGHVVALTVAALATYGLRSAFTRIALPSPPPPDW